MDEPFSHSPQSLAMIIELEQETLLELRRDSRQHSCDEIALHLLHTTRQEIQKDSNASPASAGPVPMDSMESRNTLASAVELSFSDLESNLHHITEEIGRCVQCIPLAFRDRSILLPPQK